LVWSNHIGVVKVDGIEPARGVLVFYLLEAAAAPTVCPRSPVLFCSNYTMKFGHDFLDMLYTAASHRKIYKKQGIKYSIYKTGSVSKYKKAGFFCLNL